MHLSAATPDELPVIADLVNAAYRGSGAEQGWTTEADYIDGQRTDPETLGRDLASQPDARLLAMRDAPGGPLLGCVWLEPAGEGVWYLGMLTVRPDLQDRQLGRRLLAAAEQFAAGHGARRIQMTVVGIRDTLIAWYERRGYALTGERRPFPYGDAVFGVPRRPDLDFVVLEKGVNPPLPEGVIIRLTYHGTSLSVGSSNEARDDPAQDEPERPDLPRR